MWKNIFFAAVNDCIPKYKQKRKTTALWITKDLIKLCRKKRNLYNKAKKSGSEEAWATYRALNNLARSKRNVIQQNGNTLRNLRTK